MGVAWAVCRPHPVVQPLVSRYIGYEQNDVGLPVHCGLPSRHVTVITRATYRQILERRVEENGVDFLEGVATAITPMAFYETFMVKGY